MSEHTLADNKAEEKDKNSKTCAHKYCGKEYIAKHFNAKYCDADHFSICENCEKEFAVSKKKISKNPRACSQSCASALTHTDASKEKRRENSLKKYGTEFHTQSADMIAKTKATIEQNPDKDFRIGSDNYKKLIKDKYGVDNVSSLDDVKKKKIELSLSKYGTENPFQNKDVQESYKKSMIEKYGKSPRKNQLNIKNFEEYIELEHWLINFEKENGKKATVSETAAYFNVSTTTISGLKKQKNLHKYFRIANSLKEEKFAEFLNKNFPDVRYVHNNRSVISPYELDFYFPDHNFAVEISPTTTHHSSETFLNYGKNTPKEKNYHLNKALLCEKAGIELFTMFDWMPWQKSLNMISHKLSKSSKTVYARKAKVHFIEKRKNKISRKLKEFIDDSHILGFDGRGTQYYTYLEFEDEIIGVAGFGKPRQLNIKSRKAGKQDLNDTIELTRLCFAPGVSVPGGASRLLKTFTKKYSTINPSLSKIITFSDFDLGSGKIYETLGFKTIVKPSAQKQYVHPDLLVENTETEDEADVAVHFTVKNTSLHLAGADRLLKNFPGYEPVGLVCQCSDTFHKNAECLPSNVEIMDMYGFLTIHDCGYKKWELNLDNEMI